MSPSTGDEVELGATSPSIGSADSPRTLQRYWRLALAAVLALLAWSAFRNEYGYIPLLSDIDLAIHEFGHMLFMPFGIQFLGNTMMILGGSLTQVAFPLIFFGYFLRKHDDAPRRDVFAAMVCLWWSGINLLSVAIYCADSRAGKLMLLDESTGQESDGHDWNNLLTPWGLLERHRHCAVDARDRLAGVRREHHHRSLERATTTARATRRGSGDLMLRAYRFGSAVAIVMERVRPKSYLTSQSDKTSHSGSLRSLSILAPANTSGRNIMIRRASIRSLFRMCTRRIPFSDSTSSTSPTGVFPVP